MTSELIECTPAAADATLMAASDGALITYCHQVLLGRLPRAGEITFYTRRMAAGTTRPALIATLLRSPEAAGARRRGDPGLPVDAAERRARLRCRAGWQWLPLPLVWFWHCAIGGRRSLASPAISPAMPGVAGSSARLAAAAQRPVYPGQTSTDAAADDAADRFTFALALYRARQRLA